MEVRNTTKGAKALLQAFICLQKHLKTTPGHVLDQ